MMKQLFYFLALLLTVGMADLTAQDQTGKNGQIWAQVSESKIPKVGTRYLVPEKFKTFKLDVNRMSQILMSAPMEGTPVAVMTKTLLDLPMPDGRMLTFDVVESPIMEAGLAAKFPDINTYAGNAVEDPSIYVRLDLTPQGFHAMIMIPGESSIFIDPYTHGGGDIEHYIVYDRKDYACSVPKEFECHVPDPIEFRNPVTPNAKMFGSCELRTYRLALAATGEYTAFHGGTVAGAQAAQVTTMNRVNGVYLREMAIRMNIVANNNLIIYTNAATDPYTNNNGGTMLGQNQTTCNNVIGSANYDIGHVFSTGGGGVAYLQSVCNASNKAGGVTGSAAPVGDPFDIDYVAHEMGHQFGGNHTQNNNCNRNGATAMEPGSASTIMGYAGICAPNVQNNSNDYFHGVNLAEIGAFITGGGHTCPVKTPLSNNTPAVTLASTAVSIPISTPFFLTANGTDPDPSNVLTYCWEQMNNQTSTQPPVATATGGPSFRSYNPSTNPTRYFPNLTSLAAGGPYTWEVLPSVARTMNFRVTVRDNASGGGCTADANMTVTTVAAAGPFVVTYPNATGITWAGNSTQTVTWNVANTTAAPVSCSVVDILLSTDGGLTYPTVLATAVANNGSRVVTVPNTPSTTARIMVRASGGYFFDISDNNFTITASTFDYTLSVSNPTISVCPPTNAVYNITVGSIGGYNSAVTMSLTGLPAGASANFSTNPVIPAGTSNLTISNIAAVTPGTYNMTLNATSTSGPKSVALVLVVSSPAPGGVTLTSPANAATGVNRPTSFAWSTAAGNGVTYAIDISTSPTFVPLIDNATGLATASYTSNVLSSYTTYYWRVRASNACGAGSYSATFSFTTASCTNYMSTNVPVAISASGTPTITSNLVIANTNTITDVNVINLAGTHTWINDLTVSVRSPAATSVSLWNRICNNEDDFNINFDDAAASATLPCPPVGGGTFRPAGTLSSFNGQNPNGTWVLTIVDNANQDGGSLNSWGLEVCVNLPAASCSMTASVTSSTNVLCNGASTGSATAAGAAGTTPYTYVWSNGRTTASNTGLAAGTYTVTVTDFTGCTATSAVTITQPATALSSSTSSTTNVLCFGGTTGAFTVTASGGTSPYTFNHGAGSQSNGTFTGLAAGTYNVTITDVNNCTTVRSVTITQPAAALASSTSSTTNVLCFGGNTGAFTVTATGGTSPYQFNRGTGNQGSGTFTGLAAGTYNVTITDANNCTTVRSVTITQPAAALASTTSSSTNVSCFGGNTGAFTVAATGGTTPYTFNHGTGAQSTGAFTGLTAGTYNVTITDANACTTVRSVTLTQPASALASAPVSQTNVACNAGSTGAFTLSASGGTSPYTFNHGTGAQSSGTFTSLPAGTYNVTVTDANACTTVRSFTITQPTAVTATTSSNSETCAGNNGSASVTASGGVSPYTYLWNTGGTNASITNLVAGSYNVSITDANSCRIVRTIVVSNSCSACSITTNATPTNVTCFAACTGSVVANATSGTAPYSFNWSDGGTGQTRSALCAGTYAVTVVDAGGCVGVQNVTITQPASALASAPVSQTNVACNGGSTGSFTISASGGTAPYQFNRGTGNQGSGTFTGLAAGTYNVTVTDANNCTTVRTMTITQPAVLAATTSSTTNVACNGGTTGAFTVTASGGVAPYQFNRGTGNQGSGTFSGLAAGTYNVTITDANNCTTVRSVTITQPAALTSSISSTTSVACFGQSTGAVTVAAAGGVTPYVFDIGAGNQPSGSFSGLAAGSYIVTVTDANSCTTLRSVSIGQPSAALAATTSSTNETCVGTNGTASVAPTGGSTPYFFAWGTGATNSTISGLVAGTYNVTITDGAGCTIVRSVTVINSCSACSITSTTTMSNVTCFGACNGTASVTGTSGTAPYSFSWSDGASTQSRTGLCPNTYSVTIVDAAGCTDVQTVIISQPPTGITGSVNSSSTSCVSNSGTAMVAVSGGLTPYSYLWSNAATTANISGLTAGTYSVTVSDANGCTAVFNTTINTTSGPSVTGSVGSVSCNGLSDGSITLTVVGGLAPYSFVWSNAATTQNLTGVTAGVYSVTTTDANNCSTIRTFTISEPAVLSASAVITNEVAGNDGAIDLTVTGGTAPYSFAWSNAATTEDISGLAAGSYTVTVTDANNCQLVSTHSLVFVAISNIPTIHNFVVLPNPNTGQFVVNIELDKTQESSLKLVNVLGQILVEYQYNEQFISVPFDIAHQAGGVYFVVLTTKDGLLTRKVTVAK